MKCPRCLSGDSKVIDSRPVEENNSIRRRRECESCHFRFTTYEIIDTLTPIVVKKDGSHELFDKNKVLSGLLKACQKRPIDAVPIADEIEAEIRSSMKTENILAEDRRNGHGKAEKARRGCICTFCVGPPRIQGYRHVRKRNIKPARRRRKREEII